SADRTVESETCELDVVAELHRDRDDHRQRLAGRGLLGVDDDDVRRNLVDAATRELAEIDVRLRNRERATDANVLRTALDGQVGRNGDARCGNVGGEEILALDAGLGRRGRADSAAAGQGQGALAGLDGAFEHEMFRVARA